MACRTIRGWLATLRLSHKGFVGHSNMSSVL